MWILVATPPVFGSLSKDPRAWKIPEAPDTIPCLPPTLVFLPLSAGTDLPECQNVLSYADLDSVARQGTGNRPPEKPRS